MSTDHTVDPDTVKQKLRDLHQKINSGIDYKLSFYTTAPYYIRACAYVELWKRDDQYAGFYTLRENHTHSKLKFVTLDDVRYVENITTSAESCHREEVKPFFEGFLEQVLKTVNEGNVSKSELLGPSYASLWQINDEPSDDMTIHFDPESDPIQVHTIEWGTKGLEGLIHQNISLQFDAPVPDKLFDISDECKKSPMHDEDFFFWFIYPAGAGI